MRRCITTIALLLSLLCWFGLGVTNAQSNEATLIAYVYRIDSKDCEFSPTHRRQTGFRVQGLAGIVTALHGVADCKTISATADGSPQSFTLLQIQQVDIERDVALLLSPALAELPQVGLVESPLSNTELLTAKLRIAGYPRGLEKQDIDVIESIRAIEALDDVIPNAEEPAEFIKRQSPSLDIDVLNVQAQLLPGHSGAPLVDSEDRLVAIGNGGLRGGSDGRSWAIPWPDVDLQAVDDAAIRQKFNKLREKDIAALAFSSTYPSQVSETATLATYTVQVIDATQNQPVANAEVLLTHRAGYAIGVTDSEGFYTFALVAANAGDYIQSQLQVEAAGYASYSRNVPNVPQRASPEMVRLTPLLATPTATPTLAPLVSPPAASVQLCAFAFIVLDAQSEEPIRRATISLIVGLHHDSGVTDSDGYYLTQLPCVSGEVVEARLRISAEGYTSYSRSISLIGQTIETLLKRSATPTPTLPPTPTSPPTPAATPTPLPASVSFRRGDWVEATASLRLREYPGLDAIILEKLARPEVFRIDDGPEEVDGLTWWQLRELDGAARGWAAYVDDGDEEPSLRSVAAVTPTPKGEVTVAPPPATATPPPGAASSLEILQPRWGDSISGRYEIRWRYAGVLGPNQGFDLILWYPKEPRHWGIVNAQEIAQHLVNYGNGEYSVELNVSAARSVEQYCDASYLLYVVVIQLDPYEQIGPASEMVDVRVRPISGVCP